MGMLGRLWAGRANGGRTGRIFAELEIVDSGVAGSFGLHDDVRGVSVYACAGRFDGATLDMTCTPPGDGPDADAGRLQFCGAVGPDGDISGNWSSHDGAQGTFVLFPTAR